MTKDEAMKLALDALKANVIGTSGRMPKTHEAITALRESQPYPENFIDALKYDVARRDSESAQQEPVAIHQVFIDGGWRDKEQSELWQYASELWKIRTLYTSPPAQRTWVDLTGDEIVNMLPDDDTPMSLGEAFFKFAELIEAKLRSKNT